MPPSSQNPPASARPPSEAAITGAEENPARSEAEARAIADTQDAPRSMSPRSIPPRSTPDPSPATTYLAGDVIAGKYRLSKVLGEGGMGAVWLAKNLTLDIDVAVKLIRRDFATAEASQRLLQEARAAARIGHPSIVRVFDFGTTEQKDPFIVMEVLHGESLGQTITRRRRLSPAAAVRTLLPVASALAAAHAKGIVHRDLKPDNVLLVTDDRGAVVPKIVDFGIAKLHHEEVVRTTTQAGVILGSPHYMSPEQACGRSDVDHRTDIWAFCVMLYEVATGVKPYDGSNYNALLSAILLRDPDPWSEHEVDDEELWTIVQRGLLKEADDRWQTMRELGAALAAWAQSHGVETDAAGNSLRAHWLEPEEHRPLSDRPPMSAVQSSSPRPRMISERELTPPPLPMIDDTADPAAQHADADAETSGPIRPPSSVPSPTTSTRPPERRSAALWIGPLALAVGAASAGAWIYMTGDDSTQGAASARAPAALTAPLPSEAVTQPATPASARDALPSAAPPPSAAPASSASSDAHTRPTPPGTTAPNVSKNPGGNKGPNMPVPTEPNF
ncbi:serine/threonine-protein kinase [Polyangium sp. 15x6]|uniref:serine/threonine-protein kinase n=1 Tax=Polyangium sp. 15x6 TaxID=3042687 RepID=UPI00249C08C1|nr:serine/threonine-protein kinase [Polyangium sp. 15x6]MDI3291512.1 serine/threonine-protein kinase [Polyangium sp. 15x6]